MQRAGERHEAMQAASSVVPAPKPTEDYLLSDDIKFIQPAIDHALDKIRQQLRRSPDFPHITSGGKWVYTTDGVWTGGFWAGSLWLAYAESADAEFRRAAEAFSGKLLARAHDERNHDLGFMFYPSAIHAHRIAPNPAYVQASVEAARSLARQFNPVGNFIPGWGFFGGKEWSGSSLVDTLMNLPLLVWASRNGGEDHLFDVAMRHAATSIRHHQRANGSVYHVFHFDEHTGEPLQGGTYQGLAAESSWSRGQAWALTGLSLLAGMTGRAQFLDAAARVASFLEPHLQGAPVPPWDYDVSDPAAPRDSSAGAITAFGLIRLARISGNPRHAVLARSVLQALTSRCLAPPDQDSILAHATADLPHGLGIDESTAYGDYYFLKALIALRDSARPARA
jgi:unsaturated chondroitin disaccharide hydrolase